ncbi:MAG: molybdopterin-dependent oxidoreductase [Thermodesulfobacteriota bacterium]|nr:molybdopterin-dependent oxidoreductase [Thermodesulfobacteriota bacterium]
MGNNIKKIFKTTCGMCGISCGIDVTVEDGRAVKIGPDEDHIINLLCSKSEGMLDWVYSEERITHPMKKVNGDWKRITWDEAMDIIISKLDQIRKDYGPESLAIFTGQGIGLGDTPNWAKRFCDVYGTPNATSGSSHCFFARVIGGILVSGHGYNHPVYGGTKCILIWGSNPENSSEVAMGAIDFALSYGAKLIVVDPRAIPLAKRSDIHLQLRPGTDSALVLGMIHVIISEGLYDKKFVEEWTVGFDRLSEHIKRYSPEEMEKITWVPADKIREAARMYAGNRPATILEGISLDHCTNGIQAIRGVVSLMTMCGNYDIPGGNSYVDMMPRNNMRLPDKVKKEAFDKSHPVYQEIMGGEPPVTFLPRTILTEDPYPIKAFIVQGGGVVNQFANAGRAIDALKKLDLFVCMDLFMTETAKLADIFLPACTFLEKTELFRLYMGLPLATLRTPVIEPRGESWPDWKLWFALAKGLGYGEYFPWNDVEEALTHLLGPSGITIQALKDDSRGMFWGDRDVVKRYKFRQEGFPTPSGKVEFYSERLEKFGYDPLPTYHEPAESPISRPELVEEYPFVFTTGARIREFTHSQHRNVPILRKRHPDPLMEIHPDDAKKHGLKEGDMALVESKSMSATFKAHITEDILRGVIHMEHGWGGDANVNFLTDDENLDPISGYPGFRQGLCRVKRV